MPVYLRKNMAFTPPSLADGPDDNSLQEGDFITDPEQMRDNLPQPFRMIDKIIQKLVDEVSETIVSREEERLKDATRPRAPQYQCGLRIEGSDGARCMTSSPDGCIIILGLTNGLMVIQAETQQNLAAWHEDFEPVNLHCELLENGKYLISSIDDMGVARLFSYYEETVLRLACLNEQEGDKKIIATKCETSSDGLFVGVCFESQGNCECWLEFQRIPKDTWLKEIETAAKSIKKEPPIHQSSSSTPRNQDDSTLPPGDTTVVAAGEGEGQQPEQRPETPGSQRGESTPPPEKTSFKFAALTPLLKVRSQAPPTGVSWSSPYQLSRTIDSNGEYVGIGNNHQISTQHLDQRGAMFEGRHQDLLPYQETDTAETLPLGHFHFLTGGRLLPHGLDQPLSAGQASSVCVWWEDQPQICMYSLHKQAKDLEHRPDVVWPLSSGVMASAVSPCTSLLAFGLTNTNLVVWDKYMGLPRRVIRLPGKGRVVSLKFLDPSLSEQGESTSAYKRYTQVSLLAFCGGDKVYIVPCGPGNNDPPELVPMSIEHPSEQPTMVQPVVGIPELIVTSRQNGQIFLQDLTKQGYQLCQVTLPVTFQLATPWQPVIATACNGQMLYIMGKEEISEESEEQVNMPVFVFQLQFFPTIDAYRVKQHVDTPCMLHNTVNQRVDALLKARICDQSGRKDRMQIRWHKMKQELAHVQRLRSGKVQGERKPSVDCPSIPTTPPCDNQRLLSKFWK